MLQDITYMWDLKKLQQTMNIMKKKQTHRYREQVSGYPVGKGQGSVSGQGIKWYKPLGIK